MKRFRWLAILLLPVGLAAQETAPYLLDPGATPAPTLEKQVKKAIAAPLLTIVNKPRPSPTGDAHDYISYGRYFWPDPSKPDGLPYIQKDGHPNQELIAQGDGRQTGALLDNVEVLALGWSRLHREDCARRAADWLRAWFVTSTTRIKPAFGYAQIRLGRDQNRGSASGLIDTRGLVRLVDAMQLLRGAPGVTTDEEAAVKAWFADYLQWLTTSPNGRKEHEAKNNHGSWYLVQVIAITRFLDRDDEARTYAREDFARIDWQINPDGQQPLETARPDGLSYSAFNLEAQLRVARLVAPLGIDLWNYRAPRGGGLRQALAYLKPYDANPAQWPHQQLAKQNPGFLQPLWAPPPKLDADTKPR